LLSWPADQRTRLVEAVAAACDDLAARDGPHARQLRWASELAALHPGDPGVVATLLLHLVELRPGQAVHVPPGTLHAYLQGTGVEVMAASDNVVRGGLTSKHVDVDRLLQIVEPNGGQPPHAATERRGDQLTYLTPTDEFRLTQLRIGGDLSLDGGHPQILLAVDGSLAVTASVSGDGERPAATVHIQPGQAVFVPAATRQVTLDGTAVVFRVTPGSWR
ncbi:MAG: mannose-6-phosphate isomerase, class I, partial [Nitriliruptoraceae bacterium]